MSETEQFVAGLVSLFAIFGFTAMGTAMGLSMGKKDGLSEATKSSVIMCTNNPKKCKILYDYYAVEEQKDESKSGQ